MQDESRHRDTKQALLEAAGELFAERGVDGTSVRDIVKRAGATLSAVNYHFDSKHELHLETIRFVLRDKIRFPELFAGLETVDYNDRQAVSDTMYSGIRRMVHAFLAPGQPSWYGRLITRALLDLKPGEELCIREAADYAEETLLRAVTRINGARCLAEARLWVNCLFGKLTNFVIGREMVLDDFGRKTYDAQFVEWLSYHAASDSIMPLGLPAPHRPDEVPETMDCPPLPHRAEGREGDATE